MTAQGMHVVKGDTKLHEAARNGQLQNCIDLLVIPTWLTEEHIQVARYQEDAYRIMKQHFNRNAKTPDEQPAAYHEALARMAPFMILSEKYYMHQLALANVQRSALNSALKTPFDCAEEAQASKELLALLNQRNQTLDLAIMRKIYSLLGAEGKEGVGIVAPASRKETKPK